MNPPAGRTQDLEGKGAGGLCHEIGALGITEGAGPADPGKPNSQPSSVASRSEMLLMQYRWSVGVG